MVSKKFVAFQKRVIDKNMKKFNLLEQFKEAKNNLEGVFDYEYGIKHGNL